MNKAIFVAVRLKSSRLKRKALLPIFECDKSNSECSVVECLISRLKLSRIADLIVLCTSQNPEDDPLEDIAISQSVKCYRGDELDVMSRFIDAARLFQVDTIVRVTGDNPFVDSIFIDELFSSFQNSDYDVLKIDTLPLGMGVECFSFKTLCRAYQLALDPKQSEYMTAYLFRSEYFRVFKYIPISFSRDLSHIRLTVDYIEDLHLCQLVCRLLGSTTFEFYELVTLIDTYPSLFLLNTNVKMIPLPRIRFSDQPDYSHSNKAYLLLNDPLSFNFPLFTAWLSDNNFNVEGIFEISQSCIYTMHSDLPVLGTIADIPLDALNANHLLLPKQHSSDKFLAKFSNYHYCFLPDSLS